MIRFLCALLISLLFISCSKNKAKMKSGMTPATPEISTKIPELNPDLDSTPCLAELTELKRGDILVRPNHNWFPGTSFVEGGITAGHAVIVLNDVKGITTDEVLKKAMVFESNSKDVPDELQLRKVQAYLPGPDPKYNNISFGPQHKGFRYRLRLPMRNAQRDSILGFILQQDNGVSCWRAVKFYNRKNTGNRADPKHYWYCSLLIWQAFYNILGIDLDANQGLTVYPNDLINSLYFNNDKTHKENRVRF